MAITVTLPGQSEQQDTHPDAKGVLIKEGHLLLIEGNGTATEVVAAYAPGKWASVKRETAI